LEKAFKKMARSDFILEFDGEELPCHTLILAGASPVLAAMLENNHREALGRAFLRYIYLEEIVEEIMKEEVVAFLELGEKYEVEKLKELAEEKMLQLLDKKNVVEFMMAGDLFRAAKIKAAALKLVMMNLAWLRVEGKEELRKLSQDIFIELL